MKTFYVIPALILAVVVLVSVFGGEAHSQKLGELTACGERVELLDRSGKFVVSAGSIPANILVGRTGMSIPPIFKFSSNSMKIDAEARNQFVLSFSASSPSGDRRDIALWLNKSGTVWKLVGEWVVETFNHKEEGEHNERQTFAFESDGSLRRSVKRDNIEGIETTCGQACKCKIWQTRTVFTEEEMVMRWDEAASASRQVSVRKWYVTQPEESVLSVAKKLNIGAERFTTLYYLNPGLQKLDKLAEGTKLLVEKSPR